MLLLVLLSIQSNHCMLLQTLCRERCFLKVSKCQRHCSAVVSTVPRREIPTCHDQSSFLCSHMAELWCATRVYSGLISVFSVHYTAGNDHCKIWHWLPAVCRWHWFVRFLPTWPASCHYDRTASSELLLWNQWLAVFKQAKVNDGKTEATLSESKTQQSVVLLWSICIGESEISLSSSVRQRLGTDSWLRLDYDSMND